jgi:hypothetical protein
MFASAIRSRDRGELITRPANPPLVCTCVVANVVWSGKLRPAGGGGGGAGRLPSPVRNLVTAVARALRNVTKRSGGSNRWIDSPRLWSPMAVNAAAGRHDAVLCRSRAAVSIASRTHPGHVPGSAKI